MQYNIINEKEHWNTELNSKKCAMYLLKSLELIFTDLQKYIKYRLVSKNTLILSIQKNLKFKTSA